MSTEQTNHYLHTFRFADYTINRPVYPVLTVLLHSWQWYIFGGTFSLRAHIGFTIHCWTFADTVKIIRSSCALVDFEKQRADKKLTPPSFSLRSRKPSCASCRIYYRKGGSVAPLPREHVFEPWSCFWTLLGIGISKYECRARMHCERGLWIGSCCEWIERLACPWSVTRLPALGPQRMSRLPALRGRPLARAICFAFAGKVL